MADEVVDAEVGLRTLGKLREQCREGDRFLVWTELRLAHGPSLHRPEPRGEAAVSCCSRFSREGSKPTG